MAQADNAAADPLAAFTLETLTRGSARLRPDRTAMTDSTGADFSFAQLDAAADASAARLELYGFEPGETLVVAGGASVSTIVALLAGLRAGLDVALAPLHAEPAQLAAFAAAVGGRAIAAPTAYGDFAPLDAIFDAAAQAPDIRMVCSLGPEPGDGCVELISGGVPPARARQPALARAPRIATFGPLGAVFYHRQRTLIAAALDLAARVPAGIGAPIVTTIAPGSFAGLVAGPFLSLLTGAKLHCHGPFEAARFIDAIAACAPAHVVAPGALAGALAEGGLITRSRIASLMLLDRSGEARGALAPLGDASGVALIDLHAFSEHALIAETRGADGRPLPAAREPHIIHLDGLDIVAAKRREGPGPLAFEGEAVSAG